MKIYFTPIPKFTDTSREPMILQMREECGDLSVVFEQHVLFSFWTGEGIVAKDFVEKNDIIEMFVDQNKKNFDEALMRNVLERMFTFGMITSRELISGFDDLLLGEEKVS